MSEKNSTCLWNKKKLEWATLLWGFLFLVLFAARLYEHFRILEPEEMTLSIYILTIVAESFINPETISVLSVFLILFLWLFGAKEINGEVKVDLSKIVFFLFSLYIVSFCAYRIPGILISLCLIALFVLFPDNRVSMSNWFWAVLLLFLVSNFAGLLWGLEVLDVPDSRYGFVRKMIPMVPYVNAFVVFYTLKRMQWGITQFEALFNVLALLSMAVAAEAAITFYLGIGRTTSFMGNYPLYMDTMFQSRFIAYYHVAGRLGITLFFWGLYRFSRTANWHNLILVASGFMLTFATTSRQMIFACLIGFAAWLLMGIYLVLKSRFSEKNVKFVWLICLLIVTTGGIKGTHWVSNTTQSIRHEKESVISKQFSKRTIRWARGGEIFLYNFPLGTGAGMTGYYMGASKIPWTLAEKTAEFWGHEAWYAKYLISPEALVERVGYEVGYSLHNLWVRSAVEFGLLGTLFLIYFFWRVIRQFMTIFLIQSRIGHLRDVMAGWSVLLMMFSIIFSCMFTVKFRFYWYFVVMFLFSEAWIMHLRGMYREKRAQIPNSGEPNL